MTNIKYIFRDEKKRLSIPPDNVVALLTPLGFTDGYSYLGARKMLEEAGETMGIQPLTKTLNTQIEELVTEYVCEE